MLALTSNAVDFNRQCQQIKRIRPDNTVVMNSSKTQPTQYTRQQTVVLSLHTWVNISTCLRYVWWWINSIRITCTQQQYHQALESKQTCVQRQQLQLTRCVLCSFYINCATMQNVSCSIKLNFCRLQLLCKHSNNCLSNTSHCIGQTITEQYSTLPLNNS